MSRLNLHFLGLPRIDLDGHIIHIQRRKSLALLAYLTITDDQPHRRDALATLLWSESDESKARESLCRELSSLNRALGDGWLAAHGESVSLDPDFHFGQLGLSWIGSGRPEI